MPERNEPSPPLRRQRTITNTALGRGSLPGADKPQNSPRDPSFFNAPDPYVRTRDFTETSETREIETTIKKFITNHKDFDPTHLSFRLSFLHNSEFSPLLNGKAKQYLEDRGRTQHVELLGRFKNLLEKIEEDYPWGFRDISSLEDLDVLERSPTEADEDDFLYSLTINTYENLQLYISTMMDYYKRTVYDWISWKWILPENLRKFSMKILIGDGKLIKNVNTSDTDGGAIKVFEFINCEFLDDNSFLKEDISNEELTVKNNSLTIGLGQTKASYRDYLGEGYDDSMLYLNKEAVSEERVVQTSEQNVDSIEYRERLEDKENRQLSNRNILSDISTPKMSYPTRPPIPERDDPSLLDQLRERAVNAVMNEAGRLGRQIEGKLTRELNSAIASYRSSFQNAANDFRNQQTSRILGILPSWAGQGPGGGGQGFEATENANPDVSGEAQKRQSRIEGQTSSLANENIYTGILDLISVSPVVTLGNIYD